MWRLQVARRRVKGQDETARDEWVAHTHLLSASRELRTLATCALPALLDAIHERLAKCVHDHEEALDVLTELGIQPKKDSST